MRPVTRLSVLLVVVGLAGSAFAQQPPPDPAAQPAAETEARSPWLLVPMFSSSPHSSRAASGELAFESHPDEESHAAGQTDSNTNGDDDDFNPRSSDDDRTSSPAASSPSLLDL